MEFLGKSNLRILRSLHCETSNSLELYFWIILFWKYISFIFKKQRKFICAALCNFRNIKLAQSPEPPLWNVKISRTWFLTNIISLIFSFKKIDFYAETFIRLSENYQNFRKISKENTMSSINLSNIAIYYSFIAI